MEWHQYMLQSLQLPLVCAGPAARMQICRNLTRSVRGIHTLGLRKPMFSCTVLVSSFAGPVLTGYHNQVLKLMHYRT